MSRKGKHIKKKEYNAKKILSNVLLIIFSMGIVMSIYKIIEWSKNNKKTSEIITELNNIVTIKEEESLTETEKYDIDFEKLKNINSDTVGWLKVEGTDIKYPVVQGTDNSFYLKHTFDKTYNAAGWIFADYTNQFGENRDKNTVIYGHNRKDGSMFHTLKNVLEPEWYESEEDRNVIFITENEKIIYKPFSAYEIEQELYYVTTKFSSNKEYEKFINTLKSRSNVDFGEEVSTDDEILTLSTCANNSKYRIVLHAKRVNEQATN